MRTDQGNTCTLCGRLCRYARSVCSTCRVGTGLNLMGRRNRGWCAAGDYPIEWRRGWSNEQLRKGHADYGRGLRDTATIALESEYQHRSRSRRAQAAAS